MIYDLLVRLDAYKGLGQALDKAIDYLMGLGADAPADGRISIDGDRVYGSVNAVTLVSSSPWEAHRAYIDVHVSLTGGETIEYLPVSQVDEWGPYQFDACLSESAQRGVPLAMEAGRFAVFFPWDAHRPNLGSGVGRKLVVKVALEAR